MFGYQSHHYELRPQDESRERWCCEVQVRTLLQHTVAELSHDAMYKATQGVPSQAQRLVARSMALMETTDELLCRAMEAVRDAQEPARRLAKSARKATRLLDGCDSADLMDDLMGVYSKGITSQSEASFQAFLSANGFVLDKLRTRQGKGLFAFPAVSLISYWLVHDLERKAKRDWPFPGCDSDLQLIFSDLGIVY